MESSHRSPELVGERGKTMKGRKAMDWRAR